MLFLLFNKLYCIVLYYVVNLITKSDKSYIQLSTLDTLSAVAPLYKGDV